MSEGIDINKTDGSCDCIICHYWYTGNFLNFRFQPKACHGCHDLIEKTTGFNDVAIVSVKRNDYRIYFLYMSKDETINILNNANSSKKVDHCKKLFIYSFLLLYKR